MSGRGKSTVRRRAANRAPAKLHDSGRTVAEEITVLVNTLRELAAIRATAEDAASRILDSKQLAAYTEIQQSQKEMREQMSAAGITPPPPALMRRSMGVSNTMMYSTVTPAFAAGAMISTAPAAPATPVEKKP